MEALKKGNKKDKGKKTKAERAMEKATESFLQYQQAAEERFMKWEEERWKEMELEERQRKEDRDHEMRMFEVLGRLMQPSHRQYRYYDNGPSPGFDPYNTFDS